MTTLRWSPSPVASVIAGLWSAAVGLEQVMDAVTSTAVAVRRGALPPLSPSALRQLADALRAASEAAATGTPPKAEPELPDDETLKPVSAAVRALLGMLGGAERLTTPG